MIAKEIGIRIGTAGFPRRKINAVGKPGESYTGSSDPMDSKRSENETREIGFDDSLPEIRLNLLKIKAVIAVDFNPGDGQKIIDWWEKTNKEQFFGRIKIYLNELEFLKTLDVLAGFTKEEIEENTQVVAGVQDFTLKLKELQFNLRKLRVTLRKIKSIIVKTSGFDTPDDINSLINLIMIDQKILIKLEKEPLESPTLNDIEERIIAFNKIKKDLSQPKKEKLADLIREMSKIKYLLKNNKFFSEKARKLIEKFDQLF